MKSLYDIPAPAKLNLFLHITGRRSDGYHLLQSVFMLIDWCDTLHFEVRTDGQISRQDLLSPLPPNDLITRAARALQAAAGTPLGAHIAVEKRLPAQAGMGGGSSDAASTLLALNRLWRLNFSLQELMPIGLALGADVPFFLHGRNAWVEGTGEKITPIHVPTGELLIIKPAQGLPTQLIFSDPTLKRDSQPATISGFAANPKGFGRNDLQPVASALCPGIAQALDTLAQLGLEGRMTGSGSAVFAWVPPGSEFDLCEPKAQDAQLIQRCSSLSAHPLLGWADGKGVIGT